MKSLIHCVRIVVPYRHSGCHTSTLYKSCSDYVVHPEKVIDIYTCTRLVFWFLCILHTTGKIMLNTWRHTILKWQDFQRNTRKFTNILQVVASAFRLAKKTLLTKLLKKPLTKVPQTANCDSFFCGEDHFCSDRDQFFRGWHKIVRGQDHFSSGWDNF